MAAIQGQPAPKPGSLNKPVPGSEAQDDIDKFLQSYKGAQMQPPAQSEAPPEAAPSPQEPGIAQQIGQAATSESPISNLMQTGVKIGAQGLEALGVDTNLKQQIEDMPNRIRASLAGDPDSIQLTLEKKLGKENVKRKGDSFEIRTDGKKFRELDPGTFEIVNDLFSDFAKEYIQGLGGAAGATAAAPTGPAGMMAGSALGAAAGTEAARAAGAGMGVVEAHPKSLVEQTTQSLAEGAMFAATEGIFKGLGAKFAARQERLAGLRKLEEVAPTDALREGVRMNLETLQDLHNLGLVRNIEGTNISVPANQLLPFLPKVENAAKSVASEQAFQQAQKQAAENFSATTLALVEDAAGIAKGSLAEVTKTGVPRAKGTSVEQITGLFNEVRKAEGRTIGEFRDLAKKTAEKAPLPAPQTAQVVSGLMRDLGVTMQKGKLVFPDEDALMQTLGTDSKAFVSGLKSDLQMLNDKLLKGGMTIDELIGQSQILGAKNEGARRIGGMYKSAIGRISSALREDSRNAMPMVLDPEDAVNYQAAMKRFADVSGSMKQLESYLQDDIGMSTFAKGLVNKGKGGLANLRAAKEFLLQENPQMYNDLIGQYIEELALKNRDPSKIGGFNTAGMRKDLAGLGSEYLDELFPAKGPVNKSLVLRSFDLANQIERSVIGGSDSELLANAKKGVGALSEFTSAKINAVYALMQFGTKNDRLLKLLSKEGVESFLEQTPKKNKPAMRETLNAILQLARQNGTLATINSYSEPTQMRDQIQQVQEGTPAQ